MKFRTQLASACILTIGLVLPGSSAVFLDEDWDDGDRTDTSLPEESAWFANSVSSTPTLSAAVGALTGNVLMFGTNTSSRLWITHFTPAGTPAELGAGDTLKVTLAFMATNVSTAPGTTRGLRIGLFNFSEPGAARVSADGFSTGGGAGAPGANVTGYMLNLNFAQLFTANNPLQMMKRTDLVTNNLMGTTSAYTTLSSGGGMSGTPGFSNDVPYTLEFSVKRNANSVDITTTISDTNGWSITHTASDLNNPTFRFDGLGVRPNGVADTADLFTFKRCRAELVPFQLRITSLVFVVPEGADITWDALPEKTYEVYWRAGLAATNSWTLLGSVIAAANSATMRDFDAFFEAH